MMPTQHNDSPHSFHVPVMGLGYTIDTPLKVARYGITSVVSIIEDELLERMRESICNNAEIEYLPITDKEDDYRAKRITAYLNLLHLLVKEQTEKLREKNISDTEVKKYFEMLPSSASARKQYNALPFYDRSERAPVEKTLLKNIIAGDIDVNIMTKVDKTNYDKEGNELGKEYSDALSALRGFANSTLDSSVIFSAGMNPRLYSYCEQFPDFFPDAHGILKKKIILKVSDFRSAIIQGKFLAKKGLWVSEFRVESGINCGGHAFVASGGLMGPILREFKEKRVELLEELSAECNKALQQKGLHIFTEKPSLRITAQGGVGTAFEHDFLIRQYKLDSIGWGSPFLLVPECTNVDDETLSQLATAEQSAYYVSNASPLGIPFNNFRNSTSEQQRKRRIHKHRAGSPCYKKFLVTNTEFTKAPICTASREYQKLKIDAIKHSGKDAAVIEHEIELAEEKDCLCEGLGSSALLKNKLKPSHKLTAVAICPGPNLAYFSGTFTLQQMVDHIYGRSHLLNRLERPFLFVNELKLYLDYLEQESKLYRTGVSLRKQNYFEDFRANLLSGISYYEELFPQVLSGDALKGNMDLLRVMRDTLNHLTFIIN